MNTLKLILRLTLVLILIITTQTNVAALGEAATKFQVFVPANNQSWNRYSALIVTALEDNTTFNIVDDGMDGDTDDSFSGALSKGQTYVTFIKDNGINDDSGGGSAKQDGDYFIITSSKPVIVSIATMSENQHDWLPAINGTSKGQQFFLYNLPTANNSQKRDINVMAYEDNTTVTLKKISTSSTSTTGFTAVNPNANNIVFQKTIDVGEDLIFDKNDGKNVLKDGETYLIETNKGVTVLYGSLHKNERESAAYVPASNGTGSGDLFHFTVHYQGKRKQEIRITSWDNNNNVELQYFKNGNWQTEKSWIIDALEHKDWVSTGGDIDAVFRVICASGKSVSVFAGNEIETGNGSSSDFATILPSATGIGAGNEFLAYLGSPGQQNQITDPFTNQVIGRASHLYLFSNDDTTIVTITDETTNGTLVNQTFTILPGRYADFYLDLTQWQAIYNGNGNPGSGNERPYVKVTATNPITVMNTNYSDDWMTYFPGVAQKDFTLQSNVFDINNNQVSDFDILDTALLVSTLDFNNVQHDIISPMVTLEIPDEVVILSSILKNNTTQMTYQGTVTFDNVTEKYTITFNGLPDMSPLNLYTIETEAILAINHTDGSLIENRTLITTTTTLSGIYDGQSETITEASGIVINSNISLPENIVTPQSNTWSVAWGDYNNDCLPDLFIANYDADEANILYKNNGDGTFTETGTSLFGADLANSTTGTWGDYDNDGDLDLFVANNIGYGNFLYRNEGTTFTRILNDPIVNDNGYAHGATWIDYDNDGFLDMFTSEYFATRFNNLYHNNGDGTFTKNTTAAITLDAGSSVASVWGDYDNDGDQDLFVANTNNENNFLYRNNGNGNFVKITNSPIVSDGGQSVGGSWADYDNDGDLDLFVANAGEQNNCLYNNDGNGNFTKITTGIIVNDGGHSHGSAWADVNNDGWLDLLVTNDQNSVNYLYMNDKNGGFTKVDYRLSSFTTGGGNSFGTAFADFDNDGDMDLFIANHNDQNNYLIQNDIRTKPNTNFINVKLKGTNSNQIGIGSRVAVKATIDGVSMWQTREVAGSTGGGIGGQSDTKMHFGLGNAMTIDSLIVTWTSGFKQVETNVTINQACYEITEIAGGTVSGTVYFDQNQNGIQDNNESGISGINIGIQGENRTLTTDENGYYEVILNVGQYTLTQFPGNNWSQFLPTLNGAINVNVTQVGAIYPNNNFADTASCLNPDLVVELNTTALRVGFENVYAITFRNTGTQDATNAILTVDFGQYIIPINANLDWDSENGTVYTWNLGTIEFGEAFTIFVADSVKTTAIIGDNLTVTATITAAEGECNPTDNQAIDINEAVGAVDPNDITAYPGDFIRYDQEITYRIRFQNVGNSVANRVIVRDVLPENLDISTIVRGQVSHAHRYFIEDDRTLVWDFQNINLIDSTTNEPESHGFIWFKIKPIEGIESGMQIPNTAEIFFDNAAPIITNTSIVTVTGSQEVGTLSIFPNPVGNTPVTLKLEDIDFDKDEQIQSVQIYDTRGVLLHIETGFNDKQVELLPLDLPAGQYFVVAMSNEGNRFVGKMMKL